MTSEEAINELKILKEEYWDDDGYGHETKQYDDTMLALDMAIHVLEQTRWIPIKIRPLTEEEKEHYISIGWSEDSLEFIYNRPLPDDGQEVLITDSMGNVELDTFYSDDGCYFENNCDADEVIAWMPLPNPYEESEEV